MNMHGIKILLWQSCMLHLDAFRDPRVLLGTPRPSRAKLINSGKCIHFSIQERVQRVIENETAIETQVHADGSSPFRMRSARCGLLYCAPLSLNYAWVLWVFSAARGSRNVFTNSCMINHDLQWLTVLGFGRVDSKSSNTNYLSVLSQKLIFEPIFCLCSPMHIFELCLYVLVYYFSA